MHTCENLADPLSVPRLDLLNDFEERVNEFLKIHVCQHAILGDYQDIGIEANLGALNNNDVLSTFVEAYIQELGIINEDDGDIQSRRRVVTVILLALFGWYVSDCPSIIFCGFS